MMDYESGHNNREPAVNRLFAAVIATYLLVMGLLMLFPVLGISVRLPVVLGLISGELTLLVPTVVYVLATRTKLSSVSEKWRLPVAVIPLLIVMAYCILPFISLVNLASMLIGGENAAAGLAVPMQKLPLWVSLLCVSVLPGVLEEFIFRGLIYSRYRERRAWGAVFTSALLFGLMHMNLNQLCYAFVMGVFFCLLYEGTGSLLASVLVHAVYNGNSVIMMYLTDLDALLEAAGSESADSLQQMLGSGTAEASVLMLGLAVIALLGLAAAGGLYVAIVKLCGRQKQVLLLFGRHAMKKRRALESGNMTSGKLWGPFLWGGVTLAVLAIFCDFLFW